MDLHIYKDKFVSLAKFVGLKYSVSDLKGFDCFLPIIDKIKADSSVVILKIDGERNEDIYTFIISSQRFSDGEYIRMETSDFEVGLSFICVEYAKKMWGVELQ